MPVRLVVHRGDAFVAFEFKEHPTRRDFEFGPTVMLADENPSVSDELHVPRLRMVDRDDPVTRWIGLVDVE
jgi:hypothetical protein